MNDCICTDSCIVVGRITEWNKEFNSWPNVKKSPGVSRPFKPTWVNWRGSGEREIQTEITFHQMQRVLKWVTESRPGVSCPVQVVTLPSGAAPAEWSVCSEEPLSHQSRRRRPSHHAASRPSTGSDQSADTAAASRAIPRDRPTLTSKGHGVELDFSSLNSITSVKLGKKNFN